MAGVFGSKNQKGKNYKGLLTNEMASEYNQAAKNESRPQAPPKFSLRGVLGLGQTVELGKQKDNIGSWGKEVFGSISHLAQEEKYLFDSRQKELQKNIEELREEIRQLAKATSNLETQIEKVTLDPIVQPSAYQITYLERIKNFIGNFRKNISEAGYWLEAMSNKKKKKNAFWGKVKDKKKGGEQYLFSNEHSVARSGS